MKVTQETFKPVKDLVVVLFPKIKRTTEGGVMLPESVVNNTLKDKEKFVEVIAVGPEVKQVSVGNYVLLTRAQEVPVEATDEEFVVCVAREYDVLGFHEE